MTEKVEETPEQSSHLPQTKAEATAPSNPGRQEKLFEGQAEEPEPGLRCPLLFGLKI